MNYIRKHWRGELSLATAFWINVFLLNIGVRLLQIGLNENPSIENPVTASRIAIIYLFLAITIIYPWQIIGLWRTCNHHITTHGRHFIARAVQGLIILGIFLTFGQARNSWPVYKDLYHIAFQDDELGDYSLRLIKDDSLLYLQGPLSFGVSGEVKQVIQKNSNIEGIILDSVGGRLYEGRELSKLITFHRLNTYSLNGCYSACTTVFISGENRFLGVGANLGFHQYYPTFKNIGVYIDTKKEQEKDLRIFQSQGIEPDFLEKLFDTSHDDLWYPTVDEMLAAGVIQSVINPSEILPIEYGEKAKEAFLESILATGAFKSIKRYEPETYREIVVTITRQIEQGATQIELLDQAREYLGKLSMRLLPNSSDRAIVNFFTQTMRVTEYFVKKDPILCMKFLYPEQYGTFVFSKYLTREQMTPTLEAMKRIIIDAYEMVNPTVDTQAAERFLIKALLQLGEDAEYLEVQNLRNRDQYKRHCEAVSGLYEVILREKASTAANALRYMVASIGE